MKLKYGVYYPKVPRKDLNPVVLLHSLIESKKTWLKIAPNIADGTGRLVYTPDLRNHGESPWSDEYDMDALARDLEEFLEDQKFSKVILVGHSVGGKTAIKVALKRPELIEKLVLEDASTQSISFRGALPIKTGIKAFLDIQKDLPVHYEKAEIVQYLRNFVGNLNSILRVPDELVQKYDFDLLPFNFSERSFKPELNVDVILDALINGKIQMNLSGSYNGAVLLLYGTHSQFMGETGIDMEKYFPRIKKIPLDAGHFIHHQMPDEFTKIVTNFINSESATEFQAKY